MSLLIIKGKSELYPGKYLGNQDIIICILGFKDSLVKLHTNNYIVI